MSFEFADIGITTCSRKTTVSVLDRAIVLIPEGKTIDLAGTTPGAVNALGIPQPNAAPSTAFIAGSLTGAYQWVVTFKNSKTGEFGKASAVASASPAGQGVRLTFAPITNEGDNNLVDTLQVWRTLAGGTVPFLVAEMAIATATYDDNNSDASISTNRNVPVGISSYDIYIQNSYGFGFKHGIRVFAAGAADYHDDASVYKSKVAWSEVDPIEGPMPNAWPLRNGIDTMNQKHLRSGTGLGDFVCLFEEDDIIIGAYIDDPDPLPPGNGRWEPMEVGRGAVTFKSVVNVDNDLFCLDKQGIYNYKGGQSFIDLTEPIRGVFDRINWNEVAQISGTYDDERIYFAVPLDADVECKHVLVIDRRNWQMFGRAGLRWWVYRVPAGVRDMSSGVQGPSDKAKALRHAGKRFAWFTTTAGHEYIVVPRALSDGVHPEMTTSGVTDSAGDQEFGEGVFSFGLTNAIGLYVQFDHVTTPEPLLIGDVGVPNILGYSETFELAEQLAVELPEGTAYRVGSIESLWESGQLDVGDPKTLKKLHNVKMQFKALPYQGAEVQVFTRHDRKGEFVAAKTEAREAKIRTVAYKPGFFVKTGGRVGTSNKDGYVSVPIMGDDARLVQLVLKDEGYLPWQLVGYYIDASPAKTKR